MWDYLYYDYLHSSVCLCSKHQTQRIHASSLASYLNEICLQHGSTLQGRKEAYAHLMHQNKFIPVLVSLSPLLFYLPDSSLHDPALRWISYEQIEEIIPVSVKNRETDKERMDSVLNNTAQKNRCIVRFRDGLELPLQAARIQRVYFKASVYLKLLYSSQSSQ